jgi:S-adenosylmethionine hydrolase
VTRRSSNYSIDKISKTYNEVEAGNMLGFFNSAGLLEIAINQENASKLLGLKLMDNIRIEFKW